MIGLIKIKSILKGNRKNEIRFVKSDLFFVKGKKKDFVKKNQICFKKLKKGDLVCKKKSNLFLKNNKKRLLKEDSYSWDKLIMHASHIKKKYFNLTLNSFFEISKSAIL